MTPLGCNYGATAAPGMPLDDSYCFKNNKTGAWEKEEVDDMEEADSIASTADELGTVQIYKFFKSLYKHHQKQRKTHSKPSAGPTLHCDNIKEAGAVDEKYF